MSDTKLMPCGTGRRVLDALVDLDLVESRSVARRLIAQGAVQVDGRVVMDWNAELEPHVLHDIQVGKSRRAQG